ncbi:hypothetical protein SDJN03_18294, partial [Cucurbita argyrosperma subsp. sororia]
MQATASINKELKHAIGVWTTLPLCTLPAESLPKHSKIDIINAAQPAGLPGRLPFVHAHGTYVAMPSHAHPPTLLTTQC